MKLYCLSSDPAKPCYVLSYKELLIMLDCGLTISTGKFLYHCIVESFILTLFLFRFSSKFPSFITGTEFKVRLFTKLVAERSPRSSGWRTQRMLRERFH